MGLDMMLFATKAGRSYEECVEEHSAAVRDYAEQHTFIFEFTSAIDITEDYDEVISTGFDVISELFKQNQFLGWFSKHGCKVESLGYALVQKADLVKLRKTCQKVLAHHKKAKKLLPRVDGYFFGVREYDDLYFEQLTDMVATCDEAIRLIDEEDRKIVLWAWW